MDPGLGPLPRKHSLVAVSPYSCAPAERRPFYQRVQQPLCDLLFLSLCPLLCSFSSCHLCPPPAPQPCFSLILTVFPPPGLYALLNFTDWHQEVVIYEQKCHVVSCRLRRVPQITCDSFLLHCLLACGQKPFDLDRVQSAGSGDTGGPGTAASLSISYAVCNVHRHGGEDWLGNEEQMEKIIVDVEMFMTGNKHRLVSKVTPHRSELLHRDMLFAVREKLQNFSFFLTLQILIPTWSECLSLLARP